MQAACIFFCRSSCLDIGLQHSCPQIGHFTRLHSGCSFGMFFFIGISRTPPVSFWPRGQILTSAIILSPPSPASCIRPCSLSFVWGSRIAVACSAVCFIAAIRVYYAPTSPCSGCSLSWCSHLPPSRHCFTWAHATSPNYDGWPQAPVIRRADLLHRLRQTRQFLLRCHASSCFLFSCVFMPALLRLLYRQWLSVLPFRP